MSAPEPSFDRLPPHSEAAERAVLGCALLDPKLIPKLTTFADTAFYDLRNRHLFSTMMAMHREGVPVDTVTLYTRLRDNGHADDAGGIEYVNSVSDSTSGLTTNFDTYANEVQSKFIAREGIRAATDFIGNLFDQPHRADAFLAAASESFDTARRYLPGRNGHLTIRKPDELIDMKFDDTDNFLGDRLLSSGCSLVIAGAGGIGKSRLLLQLPVCSILHQPFIGIETYGMRNRWLILQAENNNRRLQGDLRKLKALAGSEWPRVNSQLFIHTLESDSDGFLNLDSPDALRHIRDVIQDIKPNGIGWDSLYNFSMGDINSDADMRDTLRKINELSFEGDRTRFNVVLHHALTGKAGASKLLGFDRSSFGRNSKLLYNWCRAQINIAAGEGDNNESLIIGCAKNNNGREFPPFAVRLNQESMLYEVDPNFDLEAWSSDISGKKVAACTTAKVAEICSYPMSWNELKKQIEEQTGVSRATAGRYIAQARQAGLIQLNRSNDLYTSTAKRKSNA